MRTNIGSIPRRIRTGIAGTPNPRMRPGNKPTARAVPLPRIRSPPRRYSSASDSSAAEDPPQDWLPQVQSNGEPCGRDALHRAGENWGFSSPPRGHRSRRSTSSSPSGAEGARCPCCLSKTNALLALFSKRTGGGSDRVPLFGRRGER